MDDESSSLKLNFYLFSSADNKQQQPQQKLTVKENKIWRYLAFDPYISKTLHEYLALCQGEQVNG